MHAHCSTPNWHRLILLFLAGIVGCGPSSLGSPDGFSGDGGDGTVDASETRPDGAGIADAGPDIATLPPLEGVVALIARPTEFIRRIGHCIRVQALLENGDVVDVQPDTVSFETTASVEPAPWISECGGVAVRGLREGETSISLNLDDAHGVARITVLPIPADYRLRCATETLGPIGATSVDQPLFVQVGDTLIEPSEIEVFLVPSGAGTIEQHAFETEFERRDEYGVLRPRIAGEHELHCRWLEDGRALAETVLALSVASPSPDAEFRPYLVVPAAEAWWRTVVRPNECLEMNLWTSALTGMVEFRYRTQISPFDRMDVVTWTVPARAPPATEK